MTYSPVSTRPVVQRGGAKLFWFWSNSSNDDDDDGDDDEDDDDDGSGDDGSGAGDDDDFSIFPRLIYLPSLSIPLSLPTAQISRYSAKRMIGIQTIIT